MLADKMITAGATQKNAVTSRRFAVAAAAADVHLLQF
jgi:hypothetical protein